MKLIDKDALVAEINRRIEEITQTISLGDKKIQKSGGNRRAELVRFLSFLDTLEIKEVNEVPANVMLNEYGNKYISSWSGLKEYENFQVNEVIKILIPNK